MLLAEKVLAQVVAEVSAQAANPRYVEEIVGAFMRRQPIAGSFIASHQKELGPNGVLLVLLHAAIVTRCAERAAGRSLGKLPAPSLDAVSGRARDPAGFDKEQPAVADYLRANVTDDATLRDAAQRETATYLVRVIALAALDRV